LESSKKSKKILIFGAGQGSQELLRIIIEDINRISLSWEVIGFIDKDISKKGAIISGYSVIGTKYDGATNDIFGICGVMNNEIREKITNEEIIGNGLKLATLIHPSVIKASDFIPSAGLIVYPGSQISYNVRTGKGVYVNYNCVLGHDLVVDDYAYIGPSVTIPGGCKIGRLCVLGAGVNLLQGISVGDHSTIGIGTTLFRDIGKNKLVMDLPRYMESDKK
jgi:sugar O-acyltransferase (sialic acid O-acetyltransferase NeuD family)